MWDDVGYVGSVILYIAFVASELHPDAIFLQHFLT